MPGRYAGRDDPIDGRIRRGVPRRDKLGRTAGKLDCSTVVSARRAIDALGADPVGELGRSDDFGAASPGNLDRVADVIIVGMGQDDRLRREIVRRDRRGRIKGAEWLEQY